MFIAVDGIDGSGKSTLVRGLAAVLGPFDPLTTKEPTDRSFWGQRLRASAHEGRLPRTTESEYFHKDRLHHIETVIKPALRQGRIVITDRYVDSTLAFQACSPEEANILYDQFLQTGILRPDVTILLRCPVSQGLQRLQVRDKGVLSAFEDDKAQRCAKRIYDSRIGPHYQFIDASGTEENTLRQAINILKECCKMRSDIREHLERL